MSETTRVLPPVRETEIGFKVLKVPHTSHPEFNYEKAIIGMEESEIQTEILCNWLATSGIRVFPSFRYETHVATAELPFDPETPLHIGWDFGQEPACVVTQLNALGQWQIMKGFSPEAKEFSGIYSFAERVSDWLLREYAAPRGKSLKDLLMVHIGDPAGAAPISQATGRKGDVTSCFDILRRGMEIYQGEDEETGKPILLKKPGWGWRLVKGAVQIPARLESVRNRLNTLIDGLPALIVDPREEFIISGFLGGYHYHEASDGFVNVREPKKDHFSHTFDCISYIGSRLYARPAPEPDEDEEPRGIPWCSQANSGYRLS